MGKMKGITPIISIIILLLITIALAATAYSYLSGYLFSQIGTTISIPQGGAFCSGGSITLIIRNDAMDSNFTNDDIDLLTIDGSPVTANIIDIEPGKTGVLLQDNNGGAGWAKGYHEIVIGVSSNVLRQSVYCP